VVANKATPELTARQGKTLRFVVSRSRGAYEKPVAASDAVIKADWSDLPQTALQAKATLEQLERHKLIRREGKGFLATEDGEALIRQADAAGKWRD
jgi:hypothetical protein